MRYWALIAVMICAAVPAPGANARPFATAAKFSVDNDNADVQPQIRHRHLALSSAVATIEPPSGPYNKGWASIQLATDEKLRVKTVNLSVPGNTCTIAILEPDLKKFLQVYQFDGKQLRLKSKGSYVCDLKSAGRANFSLGWDVDLTTLVFAKAAEGK